MLLARNGLKSESYIVKRLRFEIPPFKVSQNISHCFQKNSVPFLVFDGYSIVKVKPFAISETKFKK